jgi:hypothetical protein
METSISDFWELKYPGKVGSCPETLDAKVRWSDYLIVFYQGFTT